MFYKINGKYYVKTANFYQELEVQKDNIIPKNGIENRIYNPSSDIKAVSWNDVLNANKKDTKKTESIEEPRISKKFKNTKIF